MPVTLNRSALEFARRAIREDRFVIDDESHWKDDEPPERAARRFLDRRGSAAFASWHLGIDETKALDDPARYCYCVGDFSAVHRCAVLAGERRARVSGHHDVECAFANLHGMLEGQLGAA